MEISFPFNWDNPYREKPLFLETSWVLTELFKKKC